MSNRNIANCLNCNKSFILKVKWQKCCSYECGYRYQNNKTTRSINNELCVRCGSSLQHKRMGAMYCSRTCKSMDHNFKHRARGGRRTTTARRRLIIERDRSVCYLCGILVPFDEVEVDHLLPRSRGGTSEPHNLAVSCMKCNRRRGNRIEIEQLMKLFELRP